MPKRWCPKRSAPQIVAVKGKASGGIVCIKHGAVEVDRQRGAIDLIERDSHLKGTSEVVEVWIGEGRESLKRVGTRRVNGPSVLLARFNQWAPKTTDRYPKIKIPKLLRLARDGYSEWFN